MMPPANVTAPAAAPGPQAAGEARLTAWLRSGVALPDWSVVSSAAARAAVVAMLEAAWDRRAWQDHTPAEDLVRRAVLELYRDLGRPPSPEEIARRADTAPDQVRMLLNRLAARDLVILKGEQITGAYPLASQPTEHWVRVGERPLHAMCAIDALGVGAMYRTDTVVRSRCRLCHAPIDIATSDGGTRLARVSPTGAVVCAGTDYRDNCAATTLCTTIAFFCGDVHLSAWRSSQPLEAPGFRLSIDEALEVGRAIFGLVLTPLQDLPEVSR